MRTPLNAIVGYVRMMQMGLLTNEKQNRAVDTVARNLTSLTHIVEDVLDVSRIVAGKLRLDMKAVELSAVIREAVDTVRPAADAKGLRLDIVLDPHAGPVGGDPDRLQQILWNLLSNAVKFTERGGTIRVRLERVKSDVEVTISDTGVGISAEFLPHVFDRFRQANASMSRSHGGLGLGLAITRHLVELQGGRIFAASDGPDTGATFRIVLPARTVSASQGPEEAHQPSAAAVVPELRGLRILAVDDDRDALTLVREILEAAGATITTAESAIHALRAIEWSEFDAMLIDLGMPEMNGFELIARVRRSDRLEIRKIPAAALTAYARSEDRSKALRSGFQMHLAKPIDPGELMAAMATLSSQGNATQD